MCVAPSDIRFADLGAPRRVWAVSAIHGELDRLYALHDGILPRLRAGDRIVYLGNYTGYGKQSRETVDELLTFRRLALSTPGVRPSDIIYLRGAQEDMWNKLLQIQFAQNPDMVFSAMLKKGLAATLESYGLAAHDGMRACVEGVLSLTRWSNRVRDQIRKNPGHDMFLTQHKRAAYTRAEARFPLLFVNAGVNPARPLELQGEGLWDAGEAFSGITEMYAPFEKVIRGYDPLHEGVRLNCVTASLDGGAGFGGKIVCAGMDSHGNMSELLHA